MNTEANTSCQNAETDPVGFFAGEINKGLKDVKLYVARGGDASSECVDAAMNELVSMISAVRNGEVATYKSLRARLSEI